MENREDDGRKPRMSRKLIVRQAPVALAVLGIAVAIFLGFAGYFTAHGG
jgi:hypothetical protein